MYDEELNFGGRVRYLPTDPYDEVQDQTDDCDDSCPDKALNKIQYVLSVRPAEMFWRLLDVFAYNALLEIINADRLLSLFSVSIVLFIAWVFVLALRFCTSPNPEKKAKQRRSNSSEVSRTEGNDQQPVDRDERKSKNQSNLNLKNVNNSKEEKMLKDSSLLVFGAQVICSGFCFYFVTASLQSIYNEVPAGSPLIGLYSGNAPFVHTILQKFQIYRYIAYSVFIILLMIINFPKLKTVNPFRKETEIQRSNAKRVVFTISNLLQITYFLSYTIKYHNNEYLIWHSILYNLPILMTVLYALNLVLCLVQKKAKFMAWMDFLRSFLICTASVIMVVLRHSGQHEDTPYYWIKRFVYLAIFDRMLESLAVFFTIVGENCADHPDADD